MSIRRTAGWEAGWYFGVFEYCAQVGNLFAIPVVSSRIGQLARGCFRFSARLAGFSDAAFGPQKRCAGFPVVHVLAWLALGFHSLPPEPGGGSVPLDCCVYVYEFQVKIRR